MRRRVVQSDQTEPGLQTVSELLQLHGQGSGSGLGRGPKPVPDGWTRLKERKLFVEAR